MSTQTLSRPASGVSRDEQHTRVELAALYRLLARHGMSNLVRQHAGARVRDEPESFLVHPYGLMFDEVRASNLVKVRLDGKVLDGSGVWRRSPRGRRAARGGGRYVSPGAVNLGRWIFDARPDVDFFVHAHCADVTAVSATGEGLQAVSEVAVSLMRGVAYLEYDYLGDEEYAELFMLTIRDKDILISHNHGYYTLGRSAGEAFLRAYALRQACAVQVRAAAAAAGAGDRLRLIDPQRVAMLQDQMEAVPQGSEDSAVEWRALVRQLDRETPDYRA